MLIKKLLLLIICLGITPILSAQKIEGWIVSSNNIPIAYSSVYLLNKQIGMMTDSAGRFSLPNTILDNHLDTLVISCMGYKNKKIPVSHIKKELQNANYKITLEDEIIILEEVVINTLSKIPKDFGFFNLKSSPIFISGKQGFRLCVFIENTDKITKVIQTVNLKFRKTNDKIKIRLFFCSKLEDRFIVNNLADEAIIVSDIPKKVLKIDVSNYSIPFPEDGIYIGIELIKADDQIQDRSKNIDLDIKCTSKREAGSTWVYQDDKWKQFPPITDEELKKIPKIFRNAVLNANAQIGITAR